MKKIALAVLVFTFLRTLVAQGSDTILNKKLLTEDQTYRHASELIARINQKQWDKLPKEAIKMGFIESVRSVAKRESWRGVGAYRKTSKNSTENENWDLKHHFGYENNFGPHELWVLYRKEDGGYIFDHVMVLGW